ncbi:hypothetical protein TDMWS_02160 [Thermodesulfomicrobium sp. WS]|uniref:zinc ribbon domain-containing protein n=1 Tax=Thermodesulfomicrobium sp. WS TaxID=3004129 RepID=UPI0024937121|nr:C4-type zinc ribbon domain-containing protein [Thermodesulfomicrobium sp. WS]BDV00131.1 hypothetical protein TDMWS_02160 [Thermodesulfomicrobium sp. WS]
MSLYMEQIEQLVVLQRVDSEILSLEKALQAAPHQLKELEKRLQYLQEQEGIIQEKLDIILEQKHKLEAEIDADDQLIKKNKNKLLQVENTKEYHAIMRDMDALEKTNRQRKEELDTILADIHELEDRKAVLGKDMQEVRARMEEQQAQLDAKLQEKRERMGKLLQEKERATKAIPQPILERYNFIRQRLESPVIVPVREGICLGCHIAIPPQNYIDLQKGEQIVSCPNCQRIMYWDKHFSPREESAEA